MYLFYVTALGLERLVEPLRNTCTMKVNPNSVKQEFEKQDELKRSALRAVAALLTIQDAGKRRKKKISNEGVSILRILNDLFLLFVSDKNPNLTEFVTLIKGTPDLQSVFETIQKDSSVSTQDSNQMDLS